MVKVGVIKAEFPLFTIPADYSPNVSWGIFRDPAITLHLGADAGSRMIADHHFAERDMPLSIAIVCHRWDAA